jgi:hypothetical protein
MRLMMSAVWELVHDFLNLRAEGRDGGERDERRAERSLTLHNRDQ